MGRLVRELDLDALLAEGRQLGLFRLNVVSLRQPEIIVLVLTLFMPLRAVYGWYSDDNEWTLRSSGC
jgi:hypothetical protein